MDFNHFGPVEIVRDSIYVTGLVIIMMMAIEYFNIATNGNKFKSLQKSPSKQVVFGALLGLIPGCTGGFAAVSLFSHNIFGIGALIAAMISDTGDESFIMFAAIPEYAIIIKAVTFSAALAVGIIVNAFVKKNKKHEEFDHNLEIHVDCYRPEKTAGNILRNLRNMTLRRFVVLVVLSGFILSLGSGLLEHDHNKDIEIEHIEQCNDRSHDHHARTGSLFGERNINILFTIIAVGAFFLVLAAKEHFLKDHLIGHIISKHLLRIFLWTFGSLLFIYLLNRIIGFDEWISDNKFLMPAIALLIGIIPQSGPHILFITLFMSGNIPLSVLMANSMVQNGHSGLPLLAESRTAFFKVKLTGIILGLAISIAGIIFGF